MASSDANAALPPEATFSEGALSQPLTFQTAGVQTVTLIDLGDSSLTGSAQTTVSQATVTNHGCGCGASPGDAVPWILALGLLVGPAARRRRG